MQNASGKLRHVWSVTVASLVVLAAFAVAPMFVTAPPLQTLDVTFHDVTPWTNTFPGDVNVTMIWLEMTASGGDVTVTSIDFTLSGSIDYPEVDSVTLWDDATSDKRQQWYECELSRNSITGSPFAIPPTGTLKECAGSPGSPYVVSQFSTRYIMVYLNVDTTADQGDNVRIEVTAINTDGTVNGGTGQTRTIEVNSVFFTDDMESGQGDWTYTGGDGGGVFPNGLWHLSSGEEDCDNNMIDLKFYHSLSTSWWYGHRYEHPLNPGHYYCEYYTWGSGGYTDKTRNWGELRTPDVDATTGSSLVLTFWHHIASEPDDFGEADIGHLWLYDVDAAQWHKLTSTPYDSSSSSWWKEIVNLSAYAGKHVQLEFRFDTLDEINNAFMGWMVDDLTLYGRAEQHDIHVNMSPEPPPVVPSGIDLGVQGRFSNIGMSDETSISIYLDVDNSTVDTGTIASLLSGDSAYQILHWNPTVLGVHWICIGADPVPGETVLWNNEACKVVEVKDTPAHYIYIVRSEGTSVQAAKDTWDHLNANWDLYGSDQVIIDYISLNTPSITYSTISSLSPAPDVLVISSSAGWIGFPPPSGEFTDTETAAITKYALEGHGLVITGSVFNELIPNNNDLAGLMGVKDQAYTTSVADSMDIDPSCAAHPLFAGVSDPFALPFTGTATPSNDGSWDAGDLTTGQYCARNADNAGSIVVNKGVYLISFGAERTPNSDIYQLLYNAFTTAQYQVNDHDVKAENIRAPNFVRVGYPASVSALITNIGKNDESVDVKLMVNAAQQDVSTILLAKAGDNQRVTLQYTPSLENDDNVCIRADIVGFSDDDPSNNEVCKTVKARDNPPVQVFVLDSWGTDNPALAPWANLNANWNLYGGTPVYIDWTTFNKENIQYQELVDMMADVLLISASHTYAEGPDPVASGWYFSASELAAIKQYVQDGHGIIITGGTFDTNSLPLHAAELAPLMGIDSGSSYMTTAGVVDLVVQNPAENHPLFINIPDNYNTANGTSLTPGFPLIGAEPWDASKLAGGVFKSLHNAGPYGAVIAYEPGGYNAVYITNWVERSANTNDKQLLYNAMVWGRSSVKGPSDLWIELWNGDTDLRLTWTENPSADLQGYHVYRANAVDGFTFGTWIVDLPAGTTEYVDPSKGVGDTNNYYYIVRAYDSKGNDEQNRNIVGKFVKTLYGGTNEISIPFELKTTTTSLVFAQLGSTWDRIMAYNAQSGMWSEWTPLGGTLTDVDHKMGLRVMMKRDVQSIPFVTVGRVPGMTDIDMYHALASDYWNFVGFPRHLATSLPEALNNYGMVGKYDLVLWYDPVDVIAHWKWFSPNDPGGSPLTELSRGMGIWVHTTQAGTWSLPGS